MSLEKDSPVQRPTQTNAKIKAMPILGGLHRIYSRVAWAEESVWVQSKPEKVYVDFEKLTEANISTMTISC